MMDTTQYCLQAYPIKLIENTIQSITFKTEIQSFPKYYSLQLEVVHYETLPIDRFRLDLDKTIFTVKQWFTFKLNNNKKEKKVHREDLKRSKFTIHQQNK